MDQEYIRSGRFIHDELLRRCIGLPDSVRQLFRRSKRIYPSILIWPTDTVQAMDGSRFSGVVFSELSLEPAARRLEIRDSILRTLAFAAAVTEQLDDCVRILFESGHGTRTWRLPIKDHGGVQVLGPAEQRDNAESIGILWRAN